MQVKFKAKLDQDGPVIVSFAGGCPPKETKSARFKLFGHSDKRKAHQRILEGETDAMRYSSRNFGAGAGKKTHSNFAVGVVKKSVIEGDPAHVTVKLLPVRTAAFAMTHSVKANESKQSVVSDNSSVDYATKRQLLVDEFGSKKRQRIVRSNQANRVNLDEGSADRLLQTTVGSTNKVDTLEFALTRTWVPPHDATASDPVEVYNLETMVGAEAWAALADSGKAMIKLAKKPAALEKANLDAVVKHCCGLLPTLEKAQQKRTARAVAYLEQLLIFWKLPRKSKASGLGESEKISEEVAGHLLDTFTIKQKKGQKIINDSYNSASEHKVMCWLAVSVLLASRCNVNKAGLTSLASDLKVTVSKLNMYFKEVGCASASKTKAALTVPLKLPELRNRAKQR